METSLKTIDKSNLTNTRIRRDFLRENTINDRDNVNFYSDNDGKYFRNQPEEPKRAYYLPMNQKIRDLNDLYDDDLNREHDVDQRYLQNDEEFLNPRGKNLNDYYHVLKKQRNRYGKKSRENDYLDRQD